MIYKVLSIDFDYFQTVHPATIDACYPDGIDVDTNTSIYRWLNAYTNNENAEKMKNVTINQGEVNLLTKLLLNQNADSPVMVTNSHKRIYDFVNSLMKQQSENSCLVVTNVDMHHDFSNGNYELDCGNWVTHLADLYSNFGFEWIANPISKGIYGFTEDDADIIKDTLEGITSRKYNAVFLCRSDPWFPPHLGPAFNDVLSIMKAHFSEINIEESVDRHRNYKRIMEQKAVRKNRLNKAEREY